MAPPRQRPADDSRSEASSGTREHKAPGPKARKSGAATASGAAAPLMSTKDMKVAATVTAVATVPGTGEDGAGQTDELPGIPWAQMPLSILHDYRHAYKLSTPSAYSKPYSKLLLSSGIGLRSPTAIAARRAQLSRSRRGVNGEQQEISPAGESERTAMTMENGLHGDHTRNNLSDDDLDRHDRNLHRIIGQGRVGKEQLALAVRKHFNSAGLVEQEAIARFLYKVREEGKGREFRLRFQP
ncbi:hypothetical protein VTN77DRAFT_7334 [Rasamsonia byssochlamydoides]|uniref:uncharacterized protein n=1 Tax=Rasamsonia byssochlamydoides TaxID=89139 RepID=UPI00374479E9